MIVHRKVQYNSPYCYSLNWLHSSHFPPKIVVPPLPGKALKRQLPFRGDEGKLFYTIGSVFSCWGRSGGVVTNFPVIVSTTECWNKLLWNWCSLVPEWKLYGPWSRLKFMQTSVGRYDLSSCWHNICLICCHGNHCCLGDAELQCSNWRWCTLSQDYLMMTL